MTDQADLIGKLADAPGWPHDAVATHGASTAVGAAGAWGITDIVSHLRASDAILSTRIFQVLVREGLPLPGFDERMWGDLYAGAAIPLDDQLAHFTLRRAELVAVLRSLSPEQWLRSGEHEQWGTLTVADICQKIVEHEAEHRAQLEQIISTRREA